MSYGRSRAGGYDEEEDYRGSSYSSRRDEDYPSSSRSTGRSETRNKLKRGMRILGKYFNERENNGDEPMYDLFKRSDRNFVGTVRRQTFERILNDAVRRAPSRIRDTVDEHLYDITEHYKEGRTEISYERFLADAKKYRREGLDDEDGRRGDDFSEGSIEPRTSIPLLQKRTRRILEDFSLSRTQMDKLRRNLELSDERDNGRLSKDVFVRILRKYCANLVDELEPREFTSFVNCFRVASSSYSAKGKVKYLLFLEYVREDKTLKAVLEETQPDFDVRRSEDSDPLSSTTLRNYRSRLEREIERGRYFGNLHEAFSKFDKNGSEKISTSEFIAGCDRYLKLDLSTREARDLMADFDTGRDGKLSYKDFKRLSSTTGEYNDNGDGSGSHAWRTLRSKCFRKLRAYQNRMQRNPVRMFEREDPDNHGFVSKRKFESICSRKLELTLSSRDLEIIAKRFRPSDRDSSYSRTSSSIDYKRFVREAGKEGSYDDETDGADSDVSRRRDSDDYPEHSDLVDSEDSSGIVWSRLRRKLQRRIEREMTFAEFAEKFVDLELDGENSRSGVVSNKDFRRTLQAETLGVSPSEEKYLIRKFKSGFGKVNWKTFLRELDIDVPGLGSGRRQGNSSNNTKRLVKKIKDEFRLNGNFKNKCRRSFRKLREHAKADSRENMDIERATDFCRKGVFSDHLQDCFRGFLSRSEQARLTEAFTEKVRNTVMVNFGLFVKRTCMEKEYITNTDDDDSGADTEFSDGDRNKHTSSIDSRGRVDMSKLLPSLRTKLEKSIIKHGLSYRQLFRKFASDRDGGVVTKRGFTSMLRYIKIKLQEKEMEALLNRYDSDMNQRISENEFLKMAGSDGSGGQKSVVEKDVSSLERKIRAQVANRKIAQGWEGYDGYKRLFAAVDTKKTGVISGEQLKEVLEKEFDGVDTEERDRLNEAHKISQLIAQIKRKIEEQILSGEVEDEQYAFASFDPKRPDVITRAEFRLGLGRMGLDLSRREVDTLLKRFTTTRGTKTDCINYEEFRKLVKMPGVRHSELQKLEKALRRKIRLRAIEIAKDIPNKTVGPKQLSYWSLTTVFSDFDVNETGAVNRAEFKKALHKMRLKLTVEEFNFLFNSMDKSKNDLVEMKEFVKFAALDREQIDEIRKRLRQRILVEWMEKGNDYWKTFSKFARTSTGERVSSTNEARRQRVYFDKPSFAAVLRYFNNTDLAKEDVEALFNEFDVNKDEKIDFNDWLKSILQHSSSQGRTRKRVFGSSSSNNVTGSPNRKSNSQTMSTKIPWRALDGGDFQTGLYYDWTEGRAPGIGNTVLSQRGTLGEWIEKEGCPMERRNFFELLNLLSIFEDKLGTRGGLVGQQDANEEGVLSLTLGPRLRAKLSFDVLNG
eukprot:g3227.t1